MEWPGRGDYLLAGTRPVVHDGKVQLETERLGGDKQVR